MAFSPEKVSTSLPAHGGALDAPRGEVTLNAKLRCERPFGGFLDPSAEGCHYCRRSRTLLSM